MHSFWGNVHNAIWIVPAKLISQLDKLDRPADGLVLYCQSPDLGQGLRIDFTFPNNNKNNKNKNNKNPHQKLSELGVLEVWNLTHKLLMGFWMNIGG